jgi:undecaprenyl-diphosphatase
VPPLPAIIVAVVQGLTLVFPVGETTHLQLWVQLEGFWNRQSPIYHLIGHGGLALALAVVLFRELAQLPRGLWQLVRGRPGVDARLLINLLILLAPVALLKVARLENFAVSAFPRVDPSLFTPAASMAAGLLLWLADRFGMAIRRIEHMTPIDALAIGIAQLLVCIPGVGLITASIVGARVLGFERVDAARIAFLVAFVGSAVEAIVGIWVETAHGGTALALEHASGLGIAFLACLVAATILLLWLRRHSFAPFAIYRILIAGATLALTLYLRR